MEIQKLCAIANVSVRCHSTKEVKLSGLNIRIRKWSVCL